MKLHYKEIGEGKPLIILHGLLGSADNWTTLARQMAGYKVYLVDQRNHGRSPHSDSLNYEVLATDLKNFVAEHGLEKPHVIGHSMGGKTAMHYAIMPDANIDKLVVVDISPRYYNVDYEDILTGLNSINLKALERREDAENQLATYVPDSDTRLFLLKNLYRDDSGSFAWRMNLPVITRNIKEVGAAIPNDRKFAGSTLFIKGSKSRYILPTDEPLIQSIFPKSTIVEIADAGHWVHAEKPKELLEVLMKFLID